MATRKRDSAWMHCSEVVEGSRGQIKCNYCSKVVSGITRFKQHLAIEGTDVTGCPDVPSEVAEEMRNSLDQFQRKVRQCRRGASEQTTTGHLFHDSVPLHNDARPDAGDHSLNQTRVERPAGWIIPGSPMTRPGGTVPQGAVNQLPGYYLQSPQGPDQLGLMMTRSARAVTLPSAVVMPRPNGNICWFHQFGPIYGWVDGFWHGPFYGTSRGPLP